MPKLKQGTIVPTEEEDEAINRGIAADPDTYELSMAEFKQMKIHSPNTDVTPKKTHAPH
ncbi:hypothetical protein ACFY89_10625 [Achromobacter spanius]|uniref:hypothetical protein n=1 Tax=Achromobacter spanius TaxID=217203 RepID=UPI0036E71F6F